MEYPQFSTQETEARRQKREFLVDNNINPYPSKVAKTHSIFEFVGKFETLGETDEVSLVGRVMAKRAHGGSTFATINDGSGQTQLFFSRDSLGEDSYDLLTKIVDTADFIAATGTPFITKRGEKTVNVKSFYIVTKSLLPLPEKWHGLSDTETRFRKRYLDLIMNEEVRERMKARSRIITAIRTVLDGQGFIEVETPTLQPIYGGGFARPFKTHHNALDADFFLRISDEMYLKRLIVGGFERVYEITKVFRNEGIDHDHNPEFTMFEAQAAYQNHEFGMDLFEEIYEKAALAALNTTDIVHGETTISVARPWKRYSMIESIEKIGGIDVSGWKTVEDAKKSLETSEIKKEKLKEMDRMFTLGELIAFAFEELVEEKLVQPTLIYDYPVEVSPLAKRHANNPSFTERFEAFALGMEIGNNYSELNDPVDLEKRFVEEKKKEEAGFDEAHQTDNDYLEAIQHGMPPSCGLGIGIDRMTMLLTGASNIKEVIAFPTLRPTNSV